MATLQGVRRDPGQGQRHSTCDIAIRDVGDDIKRIKPGMALKAKVVLERYDSCFVVPSSAVSYREQEKDTVVYVPDEAEDAAQEAFVEAYTNLSHLREPAAFPAWSYSSTTSLP